jgi:DNA-directed RNA polymerase subunit omega
LLRLLAEAKVPTTASFRRHYSSSLFNSVLANPPGVGKLGATTSPRLRKCPPWPDCQFEGEKMLDELKEEAIENKVGGRFRLSTLIQKRIKALQKGARPLVKVRGDDKLTIVIQEILQDKIYLDLSGQLQTNGPSAGDAVRRAMLSDVSD